VPIILIRNLKLNLSFKPSEVFDRMFPLTNIHVNEMTLFESRFFATDDGGGGGDRKSS